MKTTSTDALTKAQITRSLLIIGVLFFVFGFVTWINAILIPYFKIACELTNFQSYLVAFAFYISYFVMSVPASFLLKKVGFKNGMLVGFISMAVGAFIFIPAAYSRTYGIFLCGLFTIGTGLAVLQSAANPYITLLGPIERAARRISMMGICNKGAGILAPLIFSFFLLKPEDAALTAQLGTLDAAEKAAVLDALIQRVILPYACLGTVLLALGAFVRFSDLPEINTDNDQSANENGDRTKTSIWQFPHLILGAIAIFTHVGTHVIAIDTIIGYAGSMGIPLSDARLFPSLTLLATMVGYLIGIALIPHRASQLAMFRICTLLGAILSLGILLLKVNVTWFGFEADISLWLVVLLGLANSLIWAGIWPLALKDLGKFTKLGASILIMGLCGQAVMPLFYGYLADHYTFRLGYMVLVPCYLYLIYYAFWGHLARTWKWPTWHDMVVSFKASVHNNAFSRDALNVTVFPDRKALGEAAAARIASGIKRCLEYEDVINMVFGAAPSQNETLEALSKDPTIDWSRIRAFHMDEYVGVAPDAPESFGSYLREHLFNKVNPREVFLLNGLAEDPEKECERYAALLEKYPTDIVCLGIGENTHIAFNDPYVADFDDAHYVKVVTLDEKCRMQQVNDGCFPDLDSVPKQAMTLTIPALLYTKRAYCMVPGERKADAVSKTLGAKKITNKYPSSFLRAHPRVLLFLDRDSAYKVPLFGLGKPHYAYS